MKPERVNHLYRDRHPANRTGGVEGMLWCAVRARPGRNVLPADLGRPMNDARESYFEGAGGDPSAGPCCWVNGFRSRKIRST